MKAFLVVALVLILLIQPTCLFARRAGAIDVPRDWRRMHKKSLPRNGGMAIYIAFLVGCSVIGMRNPAWGFALVGSGLMVGVGLVDDICTLSPWVKLAFQIPAAFLATRITPLGTLDAFFATVWILMLTNAHNFIDGLDGLFCGCSAIESAALGVLLLAGGRSTEAAVAGCLCSACLAFRLFNRPPAKLFAGDCGSATVGYLLAVLSLPLLGREQTPLSIGALLLVFAYPLADLSASVLRRLLRGKSPFAADRGHLHHRICDAGVSPTTCMRLLLALCSLQPPWALR